MRTLAEARAEARVMDAELRTHRQHCHHCKPGLQCTEARDMAAELAAARKLVKTWFDPGPDQGTLL